MQQTSDLGDPTSTCLPPWIFLKMGDPKLSSAFLISRYPEKAYKGAAFACNIVGLLGGFAVSRNEFAEG